MRRLIFITALVVATPAAAEQVGEIGTDWTGNGIGMEAIADLKVKGITCHITYFSRGTIQGSPWSTASAAGCGRATGSRTHRTRPSPADRPPPGDRQDETNEDGEEIFSQRQSLIFTALAVRWVYDRANDTLIYAKEGAVQHQNSADRPEAPLGNCPLQELLRTHRRLAWLAHWLSGMAMS